MAWTFNGGGGRPEQYANSLILNQLTPNPRPPQRTGPPPIRLRFTAVWYHTPPAYDR